MDFACPKCKGELTLMENGVKRCPLGHSFDRAKEGYYNLLLDSGGGAHGDNRDMVVARREFLSRGYYEPLALSVAQAVERATRCGGAVLDAGAGEGYYTDIVERMLFSRDSRSNVLAFDISKDAVKRLAKKNKRICCAVASSYSVPVAEGTVDTVMNIFSPLAIEETVRVLKPHGCFVMAFPGARHLYGLKEAIYDTPYENKSQDKHILGFECVFEESVSYSLHIDNSEDIFNLFMMTPYAYRTSKEGRERVMCMKQLDTEVSFHVLTYRKP